MTAQERETIRRLRDQLVRALLEADDRRFGRKHCTGCGGDLSEYTKGCRRCWWRQYNRVRRSDETFRLAENARRWPKKYTACQ